MSHITFDQRLGRLSRKHRRMGAGVRYRVAPDGLITAHPRHAAAWPRFPVRPILLILAFALVFKALLFAALGEATYAARLDQLATGTMAERAGAWLMRPDAVTRALAGLVPDL